MKPLTPGKWYFEHSTYEPEGEIQKHRAPVTSAWDKKTHLFTSLTSEKILRNLSLLSVILGNAI